MADEPDAAGAAPVLLDARAQCEAIAFAFAALLRPPPPPGSTGLRWDLLIPDIGRQLLMLNRSPRPRLSPREERRLRESPADKLSPDDRALLARRPAPLPDKLGIAALVRAIDSTLGALDDLSPRVRAAIQDIRPDAALNLHLLRAAAKSVKVEVKNNGGRPTETIAQSIAERCALHYYHLTGEKPTDTNNFVKLLQTIFAILGDKTEASARSQAKAVARDWQSILERGFN